MIRSAPTPNGTYWRVGKASGVIGSVSWRCARLAAATSWLALGRGSKPSIILIPFWARQRSQHARYLVLLYVDGGRIPGGECLMIPLMRLALQVGQNGLRFAARRARVKPFGFLNRGGEFFQLAKFCLFHGILPARHTITNVSPAGRTAPQWTSKAAAVMTRKQTSNTATVASRFMRSTRSAASWHARRRSC